MERRRRAESFWGLHFDLHPSERDTDLGRDLTEEMVATLLARTRPDYVQYDCKGHAGWTGYPTRVGWASPGIVKDSLAIWRKVTRESGVGLYIHYSGVWDSVAVRRRPKWARVGPDFLPDRDMSSTYGPYVDELLIPQLKELVDAYDLDGAWVDGECWAVRPDFSPAARDAFLAETGLDDVPRRSGDAGWPDLLALQRRRFEDYVTHYVEALHAHGPQFQITSNWMYSARMPQPVRAPLDFLSGDYTPGEAVNSARLEGRRFASVREAQGISWDLMAWGFNFDPQARGERSLKPAIQLQQEASIVLGQGGGFQIYFKPTRAGWIDQATVDVAAEVGQFCRDRQEVSHLSDTVPQVALLLSETSHFDLLDQQGVLFSPRPLRPLEGVLHALLELHYSVDVLTESQLLGPEGRLLDYPVVVLPECHLLTPGAVERFVEYVRGGGRILAIGAAAANLFREHLEAIFEGSPAEAQANNVRATLAGKPPMLAWTGGPWQAVSLSPEAASRSRATGWRYTPFELRGEGEIASTVTRIGEGEIGAIYGPLGTAHHQFHHPATRAFIAEMVRTLFPMPAVEVGGPSSIDVSLRRKGTRTLVHLCNVTGMQVAPRYVCIDEVPAVGPVEVTIRLSHRPETVSVVPAVEGFRWQWDAAADAIRITLPVLSIHNVIVVE
jgi:hypothetical protein